MQLTTTGVLKHVHLGVGLVPQSILLWGCTAEVFPKLLCPPVTDSLSSGWTGAASAAATLPSGSWNLEVAWANQGLVHHLSKKRKTTDALWCLAQSCSTSCLLGIPFPHCATLKSLPFPKEPGSKGPGG